eukprot:gnl/TRDRNA2_/TRDRNA2_165183_c0_seq1.p1 gnl/TRDRNA2_/TRDRNA2_165183_c0~~gnl/TRDRNA2_/TRDRNA2_165183_c0_seq1.p1  ORF type:complete len:311 (-),score=50.66 gnl/TRDRNA2_/TRDRNA2_165183_c0_seq1:20-952(-)
MPMSLQRWALAGRSCCAEMRYGGARCRTAGFASVAQAMPSVRFEMMKKAPPLCMATAAGGGTTDASADGAVIADVRYEPSSRLLLVGEADFSFAAALCRSFGDDCSALTATSFESLPELRRRFGPPLAQRLASLERRLCGVHHSVPAADIPRRFRPGSFDCIAFNFPLGGSCTVKELPRVSAEAGDVHEEHAVRGRESYEALTVLLREFFAGAAYVLRPGGECHVRLTDNFATVRGLRTAQEHGLVLDSRVDFFGAFDLVYKGLGYYPAAVEHGQRRRRSGDGKRKGFDVRHSSTFVFRLGMRAAPLGAL